MSFKSIKEKVKKADSILWQSFLLSISRVFKVSKREVLFDILFILFIFLFSFGLYVYFSPVVNLIPEPFSDVLVVIGSILFGILLWEKYGHK